VRQIGYATINQCYAAFMTTQQATEKLRNTGHEVHFQSGLKGDRFVVDGFSYTRIEVIFLVEKHLRPGTQIWSKVTFASDIADIEATAIMKAVLNAYQETTLHNEVEIWRSPSAEGIVFFSTSSATTAAKH
jgi:hypothetical protein